ncbi:nucleotide kinase related to CMP and AMP kinases [Cryptosporidium sp. chipmunk genotype I]|uniref:nucleotide kinase related to CMP and AMP kinases n=1 Tax=Cryptosporidium sp. chipmunk genotype I TaxID=1280935 RepID=UPI003519F0D0|nr:nucleotide kinase related to CMP and AMP kinases [Cryptosporidium sp. chipmunk genotype I]
MQRPKIMLGKGKKPNILIIGTPGTGKTSLSKKLAEKLEGYKRIELSKAIKKHTLYKKWDDKMGASIFDESLVRRYLKNKLDKYNSKNVGIILDFHSVNFLKKKWFDIVFCLNSETHILFDRLEKRGYSQDKIKENVECEIFKVIRYDAAEIFDDEQIVDLQSNNTHEQRSNIKLILNKISSIQNT